MHNLLKSLFRLPINFSALFAAKSNHLDVYTLVDSGLRVHVGPGPINLSGWINIDAVAYPHIHLCTDSISLSQFTDSSISVIYICHCLEHFTVIEIQNILTTFFAKLAPGGVLIISVPSFDSILSIYADSNNSIESILPILYGGQDSMFNFHKSAFTYRYLSSLLISHKFVNITQWTTKELFGKSLGDWSDRFHNSRSGDKIPLSVNVIATKP